MSDDLKRFMVKLASEPDTLADFMRDPRSAMDHAGLLPEQDRSRRTALLCTSLASGSARVLLAYVRSRPTLTLSVPNQQDCSPVTLRSRPTVLSS